MQTHGNIFFLLLLFLFTFLFTFNDGSPSHTEGDVVESLTPHVAIHPDNTIAFRNMLHDKRCTICLEDMNKKDTDHLVACAQAKGAHGFHWDCLKDNILERHTKCPLCGEGVLLPVADSELRKIYRTYLKDIRNVVDRYMDYKLTDFDDLTKEPFQGDMLAMAAKMGAISLVQKNYLQEHFSIEVENLRHAYDSMLSSLAMMYKTIYIRYTNEFIERMKVKYSGGQIINSQEMQQDSQVYLRESIKYHTDIQQLWWNTLDIVWIGMITLDLYASFFHMQEPSNENFLFLKTFCGKPIEAVSNSMLEDFTQTYQNYKASFAHFQKQCQSWQSFIPEELRPFFYPKTAYGKLCQNAELKHQKFHQKLAIFAPRIFERYLQMFDVFTKRSMLEKETMTGFIEELPRESFPLLALVYITFHELSSME